ncbi:MAG: spore coat-associated protein [Symbiobacteriaceae bacterium]|jgi:predicted ribosomally synthesized peptide with SipW-like signal peptide|nr:spore coat-associated protein [Symbiobacteriaceae bacterium]
MRAKFWLTLGAVGVMALGATAGTLALFSASTPAANNQFTAGTLQLNSFRDQGDTVPGPMFYTTPAEGQTPTQLGLHPTGPWAPGDSWVRVLMVRNTGSLDAWLTSVGASKVSGSDHLAQALRYCIKEVPVGMPMPGWNVPQPQCPATNSAPGYIAIGHLWDLIDPVGGAPNAFDGGNIALNAVPGMPPKAFAFYVSLPLSADNSYQGETLKVNFYMNAVQKKNNP